MLLLDRPHPDELVSSALVRGCRHYLLPMGQVLNSGWTGEDRLFGASFLGFTPLVHLANLFNMGPRALLAGHTVLTFATAFSEREVWERAVDGALGDVHGGQALGAVIRSAIQGLPHRRFCRACVADDLRTKGESYWRLSHQLPGSLVCHVHGDTLVSTKLSIAGKGISYDLPQNCQGRPCVAGNIGDLWREVAARVAEFARRGLDQPVALPISYYRDIAVERGWLKPERDVDIGRLNAHVAAVLGKAGLAACDLIPEGNGSWPAMLLQARLKAPSGTLKHILMEQFLAAPAVDLSHKPRGMVARSRSDEDKTLAAAFRQVADGYAKRGQRAAVATLLKDAGCWGIYRHKKSSLPRLQRAVDAFRTSRNACRPLARQMLPVPGQGGMVANRSGLIDGGHLISGEEAASKLGMSPRELPVLHRKGRILATAYKGHRLWYPAFWFDGRVPPAALEAAFAGLAGRPFPEQWAALVKVWEAGRA
ncbi:TniQ family protein [Roseateles sp. NT4]|uniref:TniQ family protein n=1 Tax=Roseateles sp. NT4 TaxID=3453715 RepID=UPI003EEC97EC